ncbi:MAG: phosphopyruvate hydratase [Candidatus Rhabdochlamydia sp.]
MSKLISLTALEILDSRANPTLEVTALTEGGFEGVAAVPAGASTGIYEAVELRDHNLLRYQGKGVLKSVDLIETTLSPLLQGIDIFDQQRVDQALIEHDGTPHKSHLGANTILGVSLAIAKAAAAASHLPLYQYLNSTASSYVLPIPLMNVINGGVHADNRLAFQEFMIQPIAASSFAEAIRWGSEVFHTLKQLLKEQNHVVSVGDEGGFAPQFASHEMALDFLMHAIEKAGYRPGQQIQLALDCAASEYYDSTSHTYLGKSPSEYQHYLEKLCLNYPIASIEDPFDQNDWQSWKEFTARVKVQVVGDDIFVTNTHFLKRGIAEKTANAILIKPNQIGTLTETLQTIEMAKKHEFASILSHRSGETEDTTIADLAVATGCGQIKTGSLTRSERTAKYNRLLKIEKQLQGNCVYGNAGVKNRLKTG